MCASVLRVTVIQRKSEAVEFPPFHALCGDLIITRTLGKRGAIDSGSARRGLRRTEELSEKERKKKKSDIGLVGH